MTFQKPLAAHTFEVGVDFIHNPVEAGFFEFIHTSKFALEPTQRHRGECQ